MWLRSLQTASIEHAAPHSFDHLTTASQIRRAATRHCRLQSALSSPTIPASLRVVNYNFNHYNVLGDKRPSYLEPFLLPGGRWLLTYVFDGRDSYVLCWDTFLNECSDGETHIICPVAHCVLPLFIVDQLHGSWAQIQYEPSTERVNIAIQLMPLFFRNRVIWPSAPTETVRPRMSFFALTTSKKTSLTIRSSAKTKLGKRSAKAGGLFFMSSMSVRCLDTSKISSWSISMP